MKKCMLTLLVSVFAVSTASAQWGTISGKVIVKGDLPEAVLRFAEGKSAKDPEVCSATDVYDNGLLIDKDTKGVANCFVYLYKTPDKINDADFDPKATVYFDQENCVFKPHAMIVRAGQTVEVLNSDPIAHNTRTSGVVLQENILVGANTPKGQGEEIPTDVKERVPVKVNCDLHSKMVAYWLVVEHPYAAVTNEKGEFTIKNLPVGEHEFRVWHERCGWVERKFEVTVKAGKAQVPALVVDVDKFEE
ncbi:MAG: hypothetical protein ABJZ55_24280 [Fuerstiella sp.]